MQGIPAHATFALLRDAAEYFSTVSTVEQRAEIDCVTTPADLKRDEAMCAGSDSDIAWQKREKQQLIEESERLWGRQPDEFK